MTNENTYKEQASKPAPKQETAKAKAESKAEPKAKKYKLLKATGPVASKFGRKVATVTEDEIRQIKLSPEGLVKAGFIAEVSGDS